jgi:hypothetical protein
VSSAAIDDATAVRARTHLLANFELIRLLFATSYLPSLWIRNSG